MLTLSSLALRWLLTESQRQRVEEGGLSDGLRVYLRIATVVLLGLGTFLLSFAWIGIEDAGAGGMGGLAALVMGPLGLAAGAGGLGCYAAMQADRATRPVGTPLTGGLRLLQGIAGAVFLFVALWFGLISGLAIGDGARYMKALGVLFGPTAVVVFLGGVACLRGLRGS
jgi:ammonia channel protein AmtB